MFPPQHSIRLHCGVDNTTQYRPFTTQRCIALHGAPLLYSGHTPDTGAPDPLPKPRNAKLESATARRKLALRKKPYYVRLSPGIALGYRRNAGAGTWTVRVADGGAEWTKKIALADDLEGASAPHVLSYWQAIDTARALDPGHHDEEAREERQRQKLRAKLERSLQRQQVRDAMRTAAMQLHSKQSSEGGLIMKQHILSYLLKHLDSLTSPSPIYALSLAIFYFSGSYYHLSKRIWGLRYVFTKRIGESEQRVGYEVLGVLLVLQMTMHSILHIRETLSSLQQGQRHKDVTASSSSSSHSISLDSDGIQDRDNLLLPVSVEHPPCIPRLSASTPRYDLSTDPTAIPWIPSGQQRKCTLCLEPFKDPSVTTCGHVFCWACIRDWVREKPECPLCRQEVQASKILPLRG